MAFSEPMRIDSPAGTLFDALADARRELDWNETVSRAELVTREPIGEGTRFIVDNQGVEDDGTITTYDRPDHLVFAVTSEAMDIDIDQTFAEADGTTTAVGTFDARPMGFMKILLPLMIQRDMAKQHANFVKPCEDQAS